MLTAPVHSSGLLDSPSHPSEVPMVHSSEATKLMDAAKALRPRILADRERIEAGRRLPEDLARELARARCLWSIAQKPPSSWTLRRRSGPASWPIANVLRPDGDYRKIWHGNLLVRGAYGP